MSDRHAQGLVLSAALSGDRMSLSRTDYPGAFAPCLKSISVTTNFDDEDGCH